MWRSPARGTALLARGGWLLPGGSGLPAREVLMLPQWLGALGVCSAAPTPLSPDIPAASPLLPTAGSSPPSGAALVPPARWLGVRALRSVARPQRPAVEEKADDAAAGASGAGARAAGAGGAASRAEAGLHKLGARLARLRLPQEAPPQDAEARRSQELDAFLERERGLGSLPPPPPPAMEDVPREAQRSVRIGLVGLPNAGKSVLVNAMVGGKISAVSRKVNTTQRATLGIKTTGTCQMVFYDLPGVIARDQMRHRKHRARRVCVGGGGGLRRAAVCGGLVPREPLAQRSGAQPGEGPQPRGAAAGAARLGSWPRGCSPGNGGASVTPCGGAGSQASVALSGQSRSWGSCAGPSDTPDSA
eukprot:jgi/Tetstr1/433390/TSEL_022675.t1